MSDIIAGRNAVREALRGTRPIQKVLVLESGHGGSFEEILSLCAKRHVAVERVNKERLDRLSLTCVIKASWPLALLSHFGILMRSWKGWPKREKSLFAPSR